MKTPAFVLAGIALSTAAYPSAVSAQASDEFSLQSRTSHQSVRFAIPYWGDRNSPETWQEVTLVDDVSIRLNGRRVALDQLTERIGAASDGQPPSIRLSISDMLSMSTLVALFREFRAARYEDFIFTDLPSLSEPSGGSAPPGLARAFSGYVKSNEFPTVVSYEQGPDRCMISHDGEIVEVAELYDEAFNALDRIVQLSGGPEALMAEPPMINSLVATIQSDAQTPWRCIKVATNALYSAGYPFLRYEIVGPD